ncbi:MAG: hypothetical protein GYA36_23415 [Veillonellaceae bacterium]|nr:hypothetical protein [Veillonellaceae bacterium]
MMLARAAGSGPNRQNQLKLRSGEKEKPKRRITVVKLKCAGCGAIATFPATPKKFICKSCGAPNTPVANDPGTGDSLPCILPTGFEWKLPAGVIGEGDNMMYVSPDDGVYLTRMEWISIYGYDPKAKLEDMRRRGQKGVPGYVNISSLGRKTR